MNTATAARTLRNTIKLGTKVTGTDANGVTHTGPVIARTGAVTAVTYVIQSSVTGERVALVTAKAAK